jgi:hypothetical protein
MNMLYMPWKCMHRLLVERLRAPTLPNSVRGFVSRTSHAFATWSVVLKVSNSRGFSGRPFDPGEDLNKHDSVSHSEGLDQPFKVSKSEWEYCTGILGIQLLPHRHPNARHRQTTESDFLARERPTIVYSLL